MPMTEDDLRTALRAIPSDLPATPDRMGGIEHRVRRHRRRVVASVAAGVAVVLLAVPVALLVSQRSQRDALPVGTSERQVRDAMMQYAAFSAYWQGRAFGGAAYGRDPGVTGVVVTASPPPTACTIASMAPGEPGGTQSAWVLGTGSVIAKDGQVVAGNGLTVTRFLWPVGVTSCDPRPSSGQAMAAVPAADAGPVASDVAGAQTFADPSRPALDVEAVYRRIPDDRLTQIGRDVFASYEKWRAGIDFGTPAEQNQRVLQGLYDWLTAATTYGEPSATGLPGGQVLLTSTEWAGTAVVPDGYHVQHRSDPAKVCVDGSVDGSPVQHASSASYSDSGSAFTALDGPCP